MGLCHKNFTHKLGESSLFLILSNAHSLWVSGRLVGLLVVVFGFFPSWDINSAVLFEIV